MPERAALPADNQSGRGGFSSAMFCIFDALMADRPLVLLLVGSLLAALSFCLWVLGPAFILGTSAVWTSPRGMTGQNAMDVYQTLSGYIAFQHDEWQWPIFHVSKLGAPAGINIIFTDSLPLAALLGRILFKLTGVPVNLLGAWVAVCFTASALSLTTLVAGMGQRNIAAAAMATVCALCMPALLARWGHISLMGQFEILLAFVFYQRRHGGEKPRRMFLEAAGLLLLALWTQSYLFAMVGGIIVATVAQSASKGSLNLPMALTLLTGLAIFAGAIMVLSGYVPHSPLGDGGFGLYSWNLLSPFVPQYSGLVPSMQNRIVDGNGGQYEGFSYLGGGVLFLLIATLPWQIARLRSEVSRHPGSRRCSRLSLCSPFRTSSMWAPSRWCIYGCPIAS